MAYRSLLTVITVLWYSRGSLAEPEVITRTGVISGTSIITRRGRGVFAFRGIPYAKAPIGALRFRSPEPAEPWDGIFRANEDPVPCPQVSDDGDIIGNEDCLKLSVYTPRIDLADLLPVMVFIHGGAFVRGDISSSSLAPDFLLDHDIILVAMQYRLTALGFISTGDEVAPGNFGLKDQLLALRWVQENIENFGGDPGRVTLFGQSAGSVSVNLHVLSSQSRGLFHQFIGQSGSALCPWAFEDSTTYKDYSFSLGRNLGCPTTTSKELIDCLRNVDVGMLINDYNGFDDFRKETAITWIPTREPPGNDAFLTDLPINLILDGNLADLPNISGVVKNEGLIVTLMLYANSTLYDYFLGDVESLMTRLSSSFLIDSRASRLAADVKNFYISGIDEKNKTQILSAITDIISDSLFLFPQILQLQLATKKLTSPHYYYSFEYRGTFSKTAIILKNNENIGVTHADELIYIFPVNYTIFGVEEDSLSEEDHKMIDIITELWTSFAINGVPTTSYAERSDLWETYNDETNAHLVIGSGPQARVDLLHHFLEPRMHFWAMEILKLLLFNGR